MVGAAMSKRAKPGVFFPFDDGVIVLVGGAEGSNCQVGGGLFPASQQEMVEEHPGLDRLEFGRRKGQSAQDPLEGILQDQVTSARNGNPFALPRAAEDAASWARVSRGDERPDCLQFLPQDMHPAMRTSSRKTR